MLPARMFVCVCAIGGVVALLAASPPDQPAGDAVGVIDGADIAINGPMSVDVVGGQVKTILRSGSDVRVKSGQARISLVESGQISICGPAHFSVLKAGGSLTLALETGIVHMRLDQAPDVTVYTPQIRVQPVAVGDDPRDFLVGFENPGMMCVRAYRGAMRIEEQLNGQSVMVPQGGDVLLANGQIDLPQNGAGHCRCELEIAKAAPPVPLDPPSAPPPVRAAASDPESTVAQVTNAPERIEKPRPEDGPVYQVSLPPLTYDAAARVQPAPDPRLLAVARKVRLRPTLIFQGKVEGEPVATATAAPPPPAPPTAAASKAAPSQASVMERVRSFFRRLWTSGG